MFAYIFSSPLPNKNGPNPFNQTSPFLIALSPTNIYLYLSPKFKTLSLFPPTSHPPFLHLTHTDTHRISRLPIDSSTVDVPFPTSNQYRQQPSRSHHCLSQISAKHEVAQLLSLSSQLFHHNSVAPLQTAILYHSTRSNDVS